MLLFAPLVPLYYFLYKMHLSLYRLGLLKQYSSKKHYIISVGNLAMGGAGKTPFVSLLVSSLTKSNTKCCVVSGGYKKRLSGEYSLNKKTIKNFSAQDVGDEPYMLFQQTGAPVFVGNKKKSLSLAFSKKNFSHIVVDDGYQSHYIKKDFNILLIDCSLSLKKYKLFPRGVLREPLAAIKRADLIVFTKTNLCLEADLKEKMSFFLQHINEKKQKVLWSSFKACLLVNKKNVLVPCSEQKPTKFVGFCGIANPLSFEKTQSKTNIVCIKNFVFPDHCLYTKQDISRVVNYAKENNVFSLITTKKDYYKVLNLIPSGFNLYVLDVSHVFNKKINWSTLFRRQSKT